jgi:hypothetical protein
MWNNSLYDKYLDKYKQNIGLISDYVIKCRLDRNKNRGDMKELITVKMSVSWIVAPCSLVEVYRRFRGIFWIHHQGGLIDGSRKCFWNVSKLLPDHTALQLEDSHLHSRRRENLKSY